MLRKAFCSSRSELGQLPGGCRAQAAAAPSSQAMTRKVHGSGQRIALGQLPGRLQAQGAVEMELGGDGPGGPRRSAGRPCGRPGVSTPMALPPGPRTGSPNPNGSSGTGDVLAGEGPQHLTDG